MSKYITPSTVSLFILITLLAAIMVNSMLVPKLYGFSVVSVDGPPAPPQAVNLPVTLAATPNRYDYRFEGKLDYMPFQTSRFKIQADNCIRSLSVNDVIVPLSGNFSGNLCDYANGIIIDLKSYLKIGVNKVTVGTWDDAVPAGKLTFNMEFVL